MDLLGGVDPAVAAAALLALNGIVPLPRAAICIPAGAALGWGALGPTMLGTAIGFAIGFGLARAAFRSRIERATSRSPRLGAVIRAVDAEGWRLLALLRFASPVPGPLINAACGVTRMSFGTFMVTGLMAVLPQTLLFISVGRTGRQSLASGSLWTVDALTSLVGIAVTLLAMWRLGGAARRRTERLVTEGARTVD